MMRVLVIDDFHDSLKHFLEGIDAEVSWCADLDRNGLFRLKDNYDILIIRSKTKVDTQFLSHFKSIKCIARGGAGMDGIDVELCEEMGITLINAPEGNRDAVAEQTVAMVLAWYTKLIAANNAVYSEEWQREKYRGLEIKEKTIGIIGFGNTGKEVARRWKGFGARVICYDINPKQYNESLAEPVELSYLQKESDIISIHIPLLKSNYHLVNSSFISQLNSSTLLVNMSRGSIINTLDLLKAIAQNRLAGACLDVLEGERKGAFPVISQECKNLLEQCKEKVILTPHIGGWTQESFRKISEVLSDKIGNFIEASK